MSKKTKKNRVGLKRALEAFIATSESELSDLPTGNLRVSLCYEFLDFVSPDFLDGYLWADLFFLEGALYLEFKNEEDDTIEVVPVSEVPCEIKMVVAVTIPELLAACYKRATEMAFDPMEAITRSIESAVA